MLLISLRIRKLNLAFRFCAAKIKNVVFVHILVFSRVLLRKVFRHDQPVSWLICNLSCFGFLYPPYFALFASAAKHAGNERRASGAVQTSTVALNTVLSHTYHRLRVWDTLPM